MKPEKMPCAYSIIDKLFQDNSKSEDFEHLMGCTDCQNQIFKIESGLLFLKISRMQKYYKSQNENDLSEFMDKISLKINSGNKSHVDLVNSAIEQIGVLNNDNFSGNIPTPDFLKRIVLENLSEKKETLSEKIIIKISDGLKIIGNYIDSMYIIPDLDNVVPVRSKKPDNKNRQSTLNFFQKKEKNEIIRYHIVQDGPESILLTIKLENFESQPVSLGIRSNNQLVASQPFNNNYAYFHKLKTGDYQFEVNFSGTSSAFVIPLCII